MAEDTPAPAVSADARRLIVEHREAWQGIGWRKPGINAPQWIRTKADAAEVALSAYVAGLEAELARMRNEALEEVVQNAWDEAYALYCYAMGMCADFKPRFVVSEMENVWAERLDPSRRPALAAQEKPDAES